MTGAKKITTGSIVSQAMAQVADQCRKKFQSRPDPNGVAIAVAIPVVRAACMIPKMNGAKCLGNFGIISSEIGRRSAERSSSAMRTHAGIEGRVFLVPAQWFCAYMTFGRGALLVTGLRSAFEDLKIPPAMAEAAKPPPE
jgi:hypothetical protein